MAKKFKLIYIIDDDDIYVFTALRVLESLGVAGNIQVYDNGKKAIDQLKSVIEIGDELLPDLILLDLNMPIWDGWFFLEEFEKTDLADKVKIMIVSSSIDTEDMTRVSQHKLVNGFISKPLSKEVMQQLFE